MTAFPNVLPCPFCGEDRATDNAIRDGWEVRCQECLASVPAFNPEAHFWAVYKWNQRRLTQRHTQTLAEAALDYLDAIENPIGARESDMENAAATLRDAIEAAE